MYTDTIARLSTLLDDVQIDPSGLSSLPKREILDLSYQLDKEVPGITKHTVYYDGRVFENESIFRWWIFLWSLYAEKDGIRYDQKNLVPTFSSGNVHFQFMPLGVPISKVEHRFALYNQVKKKIKQPTCTIVIIHNNPAITSYYALVRVDKKEREVKTIINPELLKPKKIKWKVASHKMMKILGKSAVYISALNLANKSVRFAVSDVLV